MISTITRIRPAAAPISTPIHSPRVRCFFLPGEEPFHIEEAVDRVVEDEDDIMPAAFICRSGADAGVNIGRSLDCHDTVRSSLQMT